MIDLFNVSNPLKIVIADDHEIIRAGLKRLLSVEKSFKIIDEARNGEEAIELTNYHKPNVLLLDILMPIMTGIEAIPMIKKLCPETMVVMLTAFEDALHIEKAIDAGADGYLSKDITSADLVDAIKKVVLGERVFSKSILNLMQHKFQANTEDAKPVSITKREQEVLNLIAEGKTNAEIAEALFISVRTVESHRYNLMQKLQCSNTASLIRYAIKHKLTNL